MSAAPGPLLFVVPYCTMRRGVVATAARGGVVLYWERKWVKVMYSGYGMSSHVVHSVVDRVVMLIARVWLYRKNGPQFHEAPLWQSVQNALVATLCSVAAPCKAASSTCRTAVSRNSGNVYLTQFSQRFNIVVADTLPHSSLIHRTAVRMPTLLTVLAFSSKVVENVVPVTVDKFNAGWLHSHLLTIITS